MALASQGKQPQAKGKAKAKAKAKGGAGGGSSSQGGGGAVGGERQRAGELVAEQRPPQCAT